MSIIRRMPCRAARTITRPIRNGITPAASSTADSARTTITAATAIPRISRHPGAIT